MAGDAGATCPAGPQRAGGALAAPTLATGSVWVYAAAAEGATSTLTLREQPAELLRFEITVGGRRDEERATYADPNPARQGHRVLIRFALTVGATWEDAYREPGEGRSGDMNYRYDYEETARSHVYAPREITVAAGRFDAYPIDRIVQWRKSAPRWLGPPSVGMQPPSKDMALEGYTFTRRWYAPSVGRVVLRQSRDAGQDHHMPTGRFDGTPEPWLDNRGSTTSVELLRHSAPGGVRCEGDAPPRYANWPSGVGVGFVVFMADDWRRAFRDMPHRPLRAP